MSSWLVTLRLEPGPGVPEAERAVEDEERRRRVGVRADVVFPHVPHVDDHSLPLRLNQAGLESRPAAAE